MNPYKRLVKSIFFYTLLSILANGAAAQNHIGIYIGLGACKEGNSLISTKFKPGFEADVFVDLDVSKPLDLRILGGYKLRGFKDEVNDQYGNPTETAIIKYHLLTFGPDLIFPVLEKNNKIYLVAGLRGNYLASVTGSLAGAGIDTEEYSEMLDRLQLEASGGIGCEMPSGFIMEAVVSGNCLNKGNKAVNDDFRANDLYFGVSLGYRFQAKPSNSNI